MNLTIKRHNYQQLDEMWTHTSMKLIFLDKMFNIDGLYHAWRTCSACVIDRIEIQFEGWDCVHGWN
jgi:hypothetical protein